MNEADRSISSVDQAFIRRFSFVRLRPNYVALGHYLAKWEVNGDPLVDLLKEINNSVSTEDLQLEFHSLCKMETHCPACCLIFGRK